jgi:Transposase
MREEVSLVELLVTRCAGLDVAKDEVVACVRVRAGTGGRRQEVRTYPTFTSGLEALAGWLAAEGVTRVVMEATGQYWKPVWQVLEERGFVLLLVNARQVKILPGRKTDVADAAWLAELLEHGLLRGSFVPRRPSGSCGISPATASGSSRPTPPRSSASRRPWRTPGSSWTRWPPTWLGSRAGPCWPPW